MVGLAIGHDGSNPRIQTFWLPAVEEKLSKSGKEVKRYPITGFRVWDGDNSSKGRLTIPEVNGMFG